MWKAVLSDLNDLERPIHCKPTTNDYSSSSSPPTGSVASPLYATSNNNNNHSSPVVARVPLQDCLSCTGCLTLAEEQLSIQSRYQVIQLCDSWLEQGQQVVFSLQPQTIAAIAVHLGGLDYTQVAQKIAYACKQKGVGWVTDQKEARYLSLLETWEELIQRYEKEKNRLPLIISACPAWVSFMKRKRPEWMDCLSQVYSPALMTGYLWKKRKPNIKHVAIMSCYEMAVQTQTQAVEYPNGILVDALWTTEQLMQWLDWNHGDDIDSIPSTPLDTTWISLERDLCKGTSHGYFWMAVERWIDKVTIEQNGQPPQVEWMTKPEQRDHQQQVYIQWKSSQDGTMKRVGMILAYGYQSLQRWVKRGLDSDIILLEAMACPHGCVNGSGQLLTHQTKTPKEQRQYLQSIMEE
ncbi:ferredoxin hydrogenase [Galdieria sulphuraria]|uniref:Ferredoxin hydrogenase n=1 Tax=Galdieria sulphuraria TaxID=130081 RepID=M2VXG8_GALSU|nr:ferredoxin hydrogenase [Galdieria sulphuraria]EME27956.1 ferredoxin hydrogenase [Galdieria sulphuraria]|eukprot:XP_005704476.1 ferredoxin hydrogenase [Galdieria sulphuraria]